VRLAVALALAASLLIPSPAGAAAPPTPWCGADAESAADRTQDAISAFEIHVIYANPADGPDRFAELAGAIATDAASMDAWWRAQDASRAPRFDLAAFPDCASTFGRLDISAVRLPADAAAYAGDQYRLLERDLNAAGFVDPDKKYLVYYDGPAVSLPGIGAVCGQTQTGLSDGGPRAYSIVYLGGSCSSGIGAGGVATVIATHELIHGLNALVPSGPPHACPGDPGHPCDSPTDILYPPHRSDVTLDALVLDAGRDDYYGHSGTWWDVQDSSFLSHLDSPDQTPPTAPGRLTATSRGNTVLLSWQSSADDVGVAGYRVYRDGALFVRTTAPRMADNGGAGGQTHTYAVRAFDAAGFLSTKRDVRFKVGVGIVDEKGALVRDTVPPPAIGRIRPRIVRRSLVLAWPPVADAGGLRGYRVERNGRLYALVRRPSVSIPAIRARGTWAIRGVDRAGNRGLPARIVVR
jgi:hypothetical protein